VLDDERLKNPPVGEQGRARPLRRAARPHRDIRASERRMYLRVREIFAMAADYVPSLPETTHLLPVIQNKLHFAVHGQTAPELILRRADATPSPTWAHQHLERRRCTKADVGVAKNYLNEREITELNRIVTMWLDFAEDQATRRKEIFLKDWAERLDAFLSFNERQVLTGAGKRVAQGGRGACARDSTSEFAAQRRATLEAEGEAYAARVLDSGALDNGALAELGKVAKRLTKKGGRDAS
jgi:hypothetical protein